MNSAALQGRQKTMRQLINRRFFVVLSSAWIALALAAFAEDAPRVHHVFIISFDQGNPDLIEKSDMPVFHQMVAEGAHTWEAYTVVPSLTLPSHTSMLTRRRRAKAPDSLERLRTGKRLRQGADHFQHRQGARVCNGDVRRQGEIQTSQRSRAPSMTFVWPQPEDDAKSVAKAFASAVGQLKPNLCFIHFRDPDTAGHKYGAESPEKVQALKDCDDALKTIKDAIAAAGILDDSVIILTADHGSHDALNKEGKMVGTHGSADSVDVKIPWVAWGKTVKKDFTDHVACRAVRHRRDGDLAARNPCAGFLLGPPRDQRV